MQRPYQSHKNPSFAANIGAAGFVEALPANIQERVLKGAREIAFSKGDMIQSQGERGHEFWFVTAGKVHIGRHSIDGKFTIFATLGTGQSFGEQAFLGDFPRLVDAIAASEARLLRVGEAELARLLTEDAQTARTLLKAMAQIVQTALDALENSRTLSTPKRAAQALLAQCDRQSGQCDLAMTQQSLADIIGVSRVSIGKAVRELERAGLIKCGYGVIAVRDVGALKTWIIG